MPKKSNKRSNKGKRKGTRKQKQIIMIGCSKKNKKSCKNIIFSTLGNKGCPNCGPNCHCGPNCKCQHPCPGNCYLNRVNKKQHGGSNGCGSCGCPIGGLSWNEMNKFGGGIVRGGPVLIDPPSKEEYIPIPGIAQNGGQCGQCGQIPVQSGGDLPHFNFFKPPGPMPGPEAGSAWGANVKEWPGMNGIGGDRNYLNSYAGSITNDPQQQMMLNDTGYKTMNSMIGGYIYPSPNHKSPKSKSPKRRHSTSESSSSASSSSKSFSSKSSSSKSSSNKSSKRVRFNLKRGGGLIPQDLVNLGRDFNFNLKSTYNTLNGYKAPVNPLPYKDQLTGALNNNRFML